MVLPTIYSLECLTIWHCSQSHFVSEWLRNEFFVYSCVWGAEAEQELPGPGPETALRGPRQEGEGWERVGMRRRGRGGGEEGEHTREERRRREPPVDAGRRRSPLLRRGRSDATASRQPPRTERRKGRVWLGRAGAGRAS